MIDKCFFLIAKYCVIRYPSCKYHGRGSQPESWKGCIDESNGNVDFGCVAKHLEA